MTIIGLIVWQGSSLMVELPAAPTPAPAVKSCCCCAAGACQCGCPEATPPQTPAPRPARLCRCDDQPTALTTTRVVLPEARKALGHVLVTTNGPQLSALCTLDASAKDAGPPGPLSRLRTVILLT